MCVDTSMGMAQSNASLVEAFVNGDTHGQANRMKIREGPIAYSGTKHVREGQTALVGFGWAIYAMRDEFGDVWIYEGWRDWAKDKVGQSGQTTIQHMSLIKNKADDPWEADGRPQCASPPRSAKTMRSPGR